MSPTPREFVDRGRRATESSPATASRWMSGMLNSSAARVARVPAFFRGRVRAELDALGVPSRADLEQVAVRAQASSPAAAPASPGASAPAPVGDAGLVEVRRELAEMRSAFQRGFQLLASRLESVQRDTRTEVQSLRSDLSKFATDQQSAMVRLHEELAGVGRATRRDLERIRTELIEMEAATRRDLENIAGELTAVTHRPAIDTTREPLPAGASPDPVTIEITPAPAQTPVVVTGSAPGAGAAPPPPPSVDAGLAPPPPPPSAVPSRGGRWAPVWRSQDAPPVVDLADPDLDDPVPPPAGASKAPPRR